MSGAATLFVTVNASSLRPNQRALWKGWAVKCERQARRTTFLRIVDPALEGARVQIKRTQRVLIELRVTDVSPVVLPVEDDL